jgi:hypothetical protein
MKFGRDSNSFFGLRIERRWIPLKRPTARFPRWRIDPFWSSTEAVEKLWIALLASCASHSKTASSRVLHNQEASTVATAVQSFAAAFRNHSVSLKVCVTQLILSDAHRYFKWNIGRVSASISNRSGLVGEDYWKIPTMKLAVHGLLICDQKCDERSVKVRFGMIHGFHSTWLTNGNQLIVGPRSHSSKV